MIATSGLCLGSDLTGGIALTVCVVHWFRSQRRGVGLSVTLCSERCIELRVGRERLSFLGDWEKERERESRGREPVLQ